MSRFFLATAAAAVALLLPLPAFACTPIAARSWTGNITLANNASVSATDFVVNKCAFHDPKLNGFDAIAFDVSSHAGLAGAATWTTSHATSPSAVSGSFLSASCGALVGTGFNQTEKGKSSAFVIPGAAKWLLVTPATDVPGKDIAVSVSSAGRKCP